MYRVAARRFSSATKWETLMSKSELARGEIAKLQAVYGKVKNEAETTPKDVPPIDFAAYKSKIGDDELVDSMQAAYKELTYPKAQNTLLAQSEAKLTELTNQAKQAAEESSQRVKELSALLSKLTENRTTADTTVDEVAKLYPQIEEEIKTENANNKWGQGLGMGV